MARMFKKVDVIFQTDFRFTDRKTKFKYVWLKYQSILQGKILDVGADECHLKPYLSKDTEYLGIGLGGNPDLETDLEKEKILFSDGEFDCVLCLDVLEHLDNIHEVFDELCRISKRYVIVSLPNVWSGFYSMMVVGNYRPGQAIKFYGLPPEPPEDRHKWFFSAVEAENFIRVRAEKNGMRIVQIDDDPVGSEERSWRGWLRGKMRRFLYSKVFGSERLFTGTVWAVLEKGS